MVSGVEVFWIEFDPVDPTPRVLKLPKATTVSDSFPRSMRAIQTDGMNPTVVGLILVSALLAFWSGWLVLGRVSVYETSETARLEAERVHPVAAAVGGRIVASSLTLGREVRRGDILLELEAENESLGTAEERTNLATLDQHLAAMETEIAEEARAIALSSRAARASLAEATGRLAVTRAAAQQAEEQHGRFRQLRDRGLVAEADLARTAYEAEGRRAEVAATLLGIERLRAQQAAAESEEKERMGSLMRERLTLQGQRAAAASAVTRREREVEERHIRAPVDGRLAEIAPLQVGAVISQGERLASIVPAGHVRVVAEFLPSALGRLRTGQSARLSLDGFPWTQYGHLQARVHSVASETRDGHVRVELALPQSPASRVPLEHGLPGAVEVELERVAPGALLIRTLGRSMTPADAHEHDAAPERARR
jgi:multidrug resistance efflux pump